ncbi:MAG: extracellular solute-binding protein [Patescibacteria group bacterium]
MGNLKPFQVIIMGVFGFVAVLGLILFANFQGFSSGAAKVGTVSIWGTLPKEAMTRPLAAYQQNHQEYAGVSYTERPEETFDADLAEAIATGRGPDLIVISQEELVASEAKLSRIPSSTLSERDFRDQFLPISELFLVPGGTYGIPFVVDPLVLYYNRPILAGSGSALPPSTWEAVTGLASTVNRQTDAQTVVRSLIALGTYDNIEHARAILSLLFLQAGSGISERADTGLRVTLGTSAQSAFGTTPIESALTFYTEFANPTKTAYSWNRSLPGNRQAFLAGDLALYLGYASERASLELANPNLDFDMAPAPTPGLAASRITYGRAYAFAVPLAARNPEGALRVAMTLSSEETLPAFARELGMAPARRQSLRPLADDLYEPIYYPEALIATGWLSPSPADTDRVFGTMIGNIASGRESLEAAISTASRSLEAAFK